MHLVKGERVRHPSMPDWGIGQVLSDSASNKVRIFFVGAGERNLSLSKVQLVKVQGPEASHPVLDNLLIKADGTIDKYRTFSESITLFQKSFPQGFYDEKYFDEERNYKINAHNQLKETLNLNLYKKFIEQKDYDEICSRALKIVNSTNLIFPNEKMALKYGLKSSDSKILFSESLYILLQDDEDLEKRFNGFSHALNEIDASKWTTASYFLFLMYPAKYMFLKPTATQNAAKICAFDINYRPDLNWLTYKRVLEFSSYLKSELAELKPRDMIDVQSFMWVIAPD